MNRFTKLMAALAAFAALAVGGASIAGAVTKNPTPKPTASQSQQGDGEQNDATEHGEKNDKPDAGAKNEKNDPQDKADGEDSNR